MGKSAKKSYALRRSAKRSARRSVKRSAKRSASRRNNLQQSVKRAVKQYFNLHGGANESSLNIDDSKPKLTPEEINKISLEINTINKRLNELEEQEEQKALASY